MPCNATAPDNISIQIGGTEFPINTLDLFTPYDVDGQICISPFIPSGSLTSDVYILGDIFMVNVVSVFDVGAAQMRFAERSNY